MANSLSTVVVDGNHRDRIVTLEGLTNTLSTTLLDGTHSERILTLEGLTNSLSINTLSLGLSTSTNALEITNLSVSLSTAHQELDDLGLNITTDSLVVNQEFQFGNPRPNLYAVGTVDPSESYRQVLAVNASGKSEWISMETAMTSHSGRTMEVSAVNSVSTRTESLDVYETIQYDDGDRERATNIPEGCILYSDEHAVMHWKNTVRIGKSDTDSKIGFTFEKKDDLNDGITDHIMHFYMNSIGQMVIAKESLTNGGTESLSIGSGIYTIKHIFR